jgi:dTDP-4-amino-4,6-dideoxygalactose transaminase
MQKIIPYGKQYLDSVDFANVVKALKQDLITNGRSVKEFEKNLRKYFNVKFCATCSSGTAALHIAFKAVDIKPGDKIIIPSINFIASYNLLTTLGAKVYLADIDPLTGQMSPENFIKCIKENKLKNLKAVVLMYLGGTPNYVEEFYKLKLKYKFLIIEDACHAFGSFYIYNKLKHYIGSTKHSDICTFSMHPLKSITTGEGGLVCTNKKKYFEKIKLFRSHGMKKYTFTNYNILYNGFNYRLSDINCALGSSQLKKIKFFIKKRHEIAKKYIQFFSGYNKFIKVMNSENYQLSSCHLLIVYINFKNLKISKTFFINYLKKKGILCQYHYIPIYKFKIFRDKIKKNSFINSENYHKNALSLPIFYKLSFLDVKKICFIILKLINKYKK